MTKDEVSKLNALYEKRATLQKNKEYASDHNFWVGVINDAFKGTGTRNSVLNAVGGASDLIETLKRSVVGRLEAAMKTLDQQIIDLGGEP